MVALVLALTKQLPAVLSFPASMSRLLQFDLSGPKAHSEPSQTFEMELFAKIVYDF